MDVFTLLEEGPREYDFHLPHQELFKLQSETIEAKLKEKGTGKDLGKLVILEATNRFSEDVVLETSPPESCFDRAEEIYIFIKPGIYLQLVEKGRVNCEGAYENFTFQVQS
jgi:hypothetical protein